MGKYGQIFLGHDEKTYGKEGTGWVDYDPDFECYGPPGLPGRSCPYMLDESQNLNKHSDNDRLLHIAIPSYRDRMCPKTLYNIFTKSEFPNQIRVRVLQQNDPIQDEDCLEAYCKLFPSEDDCPYKDYIYIHKVHAKDAEGPTWARGLISKDIADAAAQGHISTQDFCMSTDSHMDFESDWDAKMIDMWNMVKNEYAVLSTYVAGTEQLGVNLNNQHEVPHLCMVTFTMNVRTHATKCARGLTRPKLTNAIWGAGLSFSKCHAELKVPVDPHTPGIFDGEEFNRAARFFTYGYDIYTPHRVYVLHNYNKSEYAAGGMSWSRNTPYDQVAKSHTRLKTMIDVPGGETDPDKILELKQSKFGIGDRRTIDQLIQFSGIDLRHGKPSVDGKNRCGNIQWIPFKEHSKGVNYIPRFDENEQPLDVPDEGSVWLQVGNAASRPMNHNDVAIQPDTKEKSKPPIGKAMDTDMKEISKPPIGKAMEMQLRKQKALPKVVSGGHTNFKYRHPESLPFLVKLTVFILVAGMMTVITCTKGTGRGSKRRRKRRSL